MARQDGDGGNGDGRDATSGKREKEQFARERQNETHDAVFATRGIN